MIKLFKNFFEDKKILLTGHTGFIGSWLSIMLNEVGAFVIGYALPPLTKNDNFVKADLEHKINHNIGDIRNYDKLKKISDKYKPDIIYHLAAQPLVRRSYIIPKDTFDINIGGTINILEVFKKSESSNILINLTTDKVYDNLELKEGYKETDRIGGYDPYSSSKACSELISVAYQSSFFKVSKSKKKLSTVRFGNVIGGGDWQIDRLIPDVMRAIKNNDDVIIRNPFAIRPWQYVLEPLRGLLLLNLKMAKENNNYSSAWNFGPKMNEIYTVKQLIDEIAKELNLDDNKIIFEKPKNTYHETNRLLLNITKAIKELDWQPSLNLTNTIKYVCDWYKEPNVTYNFDVDQIKKYYRELEKHEIYQNKN